MKTDLLDRLSQLEANSRLLEPTPGARTKLNSAAIAHAGNFLDGIGTRPVFSTQNQDGRALYETPISEEPAALEATLRLLSEQVERPGISPTSPMHFGYIPGGGIYHSAVADYLAAVSNKYAGAFFAAPGAVRMERLLIRWMAGFLGYPDTAAGDLTSGGSTANLIAIIVARESAGLKSRHIEKSPVYVTAHTHHSVLKALMSAGLRECPLRQIELDECYRMHSAALESAMASDKRKGLNPWLVIAAAGSTDVGAVDPLTDIAGIAAKHDAWLHVDAAYGGPFALCDPGKAVLEGIGRADSITIDPHKGLFLPYGSGAVLVRDGMKLRDAFRFAANYMQDMPAQGRADEVSPMDVSLEMSRHHRGLRLWLPLQLLGLKPFRAALEEKMLLARYFHARLGETEGFEVGINPDLSIVTYRYLPKSGDPEQFNQRLVAAVQKGGEAFVSSTMVDGRFSLRMAALCFRSHLEHIDRLIDILVDQARCLEES